MWYLAGLFLGVNWTMPLIQNMQKKTCSYWISVNHFLQKHSQSEGKIISAKKRIFVIILLNIHSGTRSQIEWLKIKKWSTFLVATNRLTSVIDCSCQLSEFGVSCRTNPIVLFGSKLQWLYWTYVTHTESIKIIMSYLLLTAVLKNLQQPHIAGKGSILQ
jgi:hypothetical protein